MLKGESGKLRKKYNATQGYKVYPVFYTLNRKPANTTTPGLTYKHTRVSRVYTCTHVYVLKKHIPVLHIHILAASEY